MNVVCENFKAACKMITITNGKFDTLLSQMTLLESQGFAVKSSVESLLAQKVDFSTTMTCALTKVSEMSIELFDKANSIK